MGQNFLPLPTALGVGSVAGTALWALAFYLGFSPVADRIIDQCHCWLKALERAQTADSQRRSDSSSETSIAILASVGSLVPFLIVGGLIHYGLTVSLGGSWAVSMGLLASIGSGVYELGRRHGQASG